MLGVSGYRNSTFVGGAARVWFIKHDAASVINPAEVVPNVFALEGLNAWLLRSLFQRPRDDDTVHRDQSTNDRQSQNHRNWTRVFPHIFNSARANEQVSFHLARFQPKPAQND